MMPTPAVGGTDAGRDKFRTADARGEGPPLDIPRGMEIARRSLDSGDGGAADAILVIPRKNRRQKRWAPSVLESALDRDRYRSGQKRQEMPARRTRRLLVASS